MAGKSPEDRGNVDCGVEAVLVEPRMTSMHLAQEYGAEEAAESHTVGMTRRGRQNRSVGLR